METPSEIIKKVEDTEKDEFQSLFNRQDEDFDLWDMAPPPITAGEVSLRKKTKAHGSDITIVSNDLRTFSDNTSSILASSDKNIMVRMAEELTGEDKREDIGKLERLFNFALEKADERLRRLLLPPLRESLIWYSLIRGWVAARILVYKDGNNVIFDFLPLDPRNLVYRIGGKGILWSGYKSLRSKTAIEDEYGYEPKEEKDNLVVDYFKEENGKIWNAVVCEDTFLKEFTELKIPSMPILIMPVSTRPPVGGSDKMKGYGECIFAAARNINSIRNRFATIVANHANLMANQALLNYRDEMGSEVKTTTNVPGGVIDLVMGHNKIEESPMKEISPTVVNILNWLNEQMEQAMLPKIPIDRPPPSGTLYNLAQEAGNKVFNPQLRNLEYFYADICHLIEEQLIAGELKVKVEGQEKDKYFETQVTPVDLKQPHTINVSFTARTPWSQLDTAQVAEMLKRLGVPDSFIWEYIMKFPDPKGMKGQAALELAKQSPRVAMLEAIIAARKRGEHEVADTLEEDLYNFSMQEEMQREAFEAEATEPVEERETETPPVVEQPPMEAI